MDELGRFSVLFVCTGNICRSPIAEQVFRTRFGVTDAVFSSAGTEAVVGQGMPREAREVAARLGAGEQKHVARQLNAQLLKSSDLVIALTRRHRSEIVRTLPKASRYTFTLRELARLVTTVADDPTFVAPSGAGLSERLRAAIPLLASYRGHLAPPLAPEDNDIPDPYRRGKAAYKLAGELIDDSTIQIATALRIVATRSTQ